MLGMEAGAADMIFHVDIDAFFASVEQVLDPSLRGRPVIVGGRPDDRSVVASASYEARARGVKTAMPIAQAHRICPDGAFLRGTYAHYQQAADRVFAICADFTPAVEPASIDEGYLDMRGTERLWRRPEMLNEEHLTPNHGSTTTGGSVPPGQSALDIRRSFVIRHSSLDIRCRRPWPESAAIALRGRILAETGLHVSIGVGTNKLIARVATDLAKPNGVCSVRAGCEEAFLAPMPIEVIPGIGRKTADRLRQAGVQTVGDLRQVPARMLENRFGVLGRELADRAAGRDDRPVLAGRRERRSISRESSFERDQPDRGAALAMLYYLTERAAWSLRSDGLRCRTVAVKVRYADFSQPAGSVSLPEPTDQEAVLFASALRLFERLDTRRLAFRLVGVCLEGLGPSDARQMGLFDESAAQRRQRLNAAQDAIRARFGFSSLVTGRSIELLDDYASDANGFRLRTSCLTK